MRKRRKIGAACILIPAMVLAFGVLSGCNEDRNDEVGVIEAASEDIAENTAYESDTVIVWQDALLEEVVREMLEKPEGEITCADVEGITYLDLSPTKVECIDDLKYFVNLEHLNLSSTRVADVGVLSELSNLKEFVSLNRYIEDYSALNDVEGIRYVYFGNLETFDFGWLKDVETLEELGVVGIIEDPDDLVELMDRNPNLKTLTLSDNGLKDFGFLDECKYKENYEMLNLQSFRLQGEYAELDVNDITGYVNLQGLYIYNTILKNAKKLEQLDNVFEMYISGCEIDKEAVSAILEMDNLSILHMYGCEIEDEELLRQSNKWRELYINE